MQTLIGQKRAEKERNPSSMMIYTEFQKRPKRKPRSEQ